MSTLLKMFGWMSAILIGLFFAVFVALPLLDTNDSVVFEMGVFGLALGKYLGLTLFLVVVPIWSANRLNRKRVKANRRGELK